MKWPSWAYNLIRHSQKKVQKFIGWVRCQHHLIRLWRACCMHMSALLYTCIFSTTSTTQFYIYGDTREIYNYRVLIVYLHINISMVNLIAFMALTLKRSHSWWTGSWNIYISREILFWHIYMLHVEILFWHINDISQILK